MTPLTFSFQQPRTVLSILFKKAKSLGLIGGVQIRQNGLTIYHLQFADDSIVFSNSSWHNALTIKRILRCIGVITGLRTNYHKSTARRVMQVSQMNLPMTWQRHKVAISSLYKSNTWDCLWGAAQDFEAFGMQ